MAAANTDRFIVRAEIRPSGASAPGDTVISYGFDVTASSIFVVTEWHAPIGTAVSLRLSFPRILDPVDLVARIADIRIAGEPGEPGGIPLTFDDPAPCPRLIAHLYRAATPPARPT